MFGLSMGLPLLKAQAAVGDEASKAIAALVEKSIETITEREQEKCKTAAANKLLGSGGDRFGKLLPSLTQRPWWRRR